MFQIARSLNLYKLRPLGCLILKVYMLPLKSIAKYVQEGHFVELVFLLLPISDFVYDQNNQLATEIKDGIRVNQLV